MASKDLTIRLLGDLSDLQKKLNQASNDLGKVGATMTKKVTPAAAGAAVALTKLGNDWNDASDAIIIGTGASGDALDGLLGSAKKVAGQVPNDFGEVGTAIAEVNTRLGLTGPELETTTKSFLDLARVTGTDVKSNIGLVTRVFGDWSVATADQAGTMDTLFAATQQTGIGIDRLSTLVVQFGAPMRQLGFSLDESIALFGKFEKEGVNIEAVMSGLRMGLGRMAKAGEEPIDTFQRLITEIKEAGSQGEANAIALDGFGQRAGPDMAAAIREGRFELGELVNSLGNSEGALADAADRTIHLDDRLRMLKNRITAAIGPFGEVGGAAAGVVASMGPLLFGLGQLGPALVKATQKMGGLRGSLTKLGGALGVAGVALAAYAVHQQRVAERAQEASEAMSELSRVAEEDIGRTLTDAFYKAAFATGDWNEAADQIARTNLEGAKRARDWAATQEDGAEITAYLTKAIQKEEAARAQSIKTTEQYSEASDEATEATDDQSESVSELNQWVDKGRYLQEQYEKATDAKAKADEEAAAAAEKHKGKLDSLLDSVYEATGGVFAYEKATIDLAQEVAALAEQEAATKAVLDDSTASAADKQAALYELREAQIATAEQAWETAQAYSREKGASEGSAEAVRLQREELKRQQDAYPGLRAEIQKYIDILNRIPTSRMTTVGITTSGGGNVRTGGDGSREAPREFDKGGVVPGPRGSRQVIIAHGGETVLPTHKGETGAVVGLPGPLDLSDDTIMKLAAAMGRAAAMRDASLAGALTQGRRP